jgi:nucleotide-binding universal stress UspA family protein
MYQRILVPLDESKCAEAILPHVIDLATHYEAEVLLLRVFEEEPILPTDEAIETGPDIRAGRELRRLHGVEDYLAFWQKKLEGLGVRTHTRVEYGNVAATIVRTADREEVDLVAMGSHCRTGLSRVLRGSVAQEVMHDLSCPLLLLKA